MVLLQNSLSIDVQYIESHQYFLYISAHLNQISSTPINGRNAVKTFVRLFWNYLKT